MNLVLNLFATFFRIGAFSFGGGYAMIAFIQKEIIENHGWLTLTEFMDVVAIAEMTPGPIAVNSATFVGYRVAGIAGAAAATTGVVLPSLIIVLALTWLMSRYRSLPVVDRFFTGVRPAVVGLIVMAAWLVGKEAFRSGYRPMITAAAVMLALIKTKIHPIILIVGAGALGALLP